MPGAGWVHRWALRGLCVRTEYKLEGTAIESEIGETMRPPEAHVMSPGRKIPVVSTNSQTN